MSKHSRGSTEKRVDARFKVKGNNIEIRLYGPKKQMTYEFYMYLKAHDYWNINDDYINHRERHEKIIAAYTGQRYQKTETYNTHLPLSDWLKVKRLSAYGYNLQSNLVKALVPVLEPITEPDCLQDVAIEVAWMLIKAMEKEDSE